MSYALPEFLNQINFKLWLYFTYIYCITTTQLLQIFTNTQLLNTKASELHRRNL